MKQRRCGYCGSVFRPRRKGIDACSVVCRHAISQQKRHKNSQPGSKARGSTAGRLSAEASGRVSVEQYRALMRDEP
jgi:hypothetical protein